MQHARDGWGAYTLGKSPRWYEEVLWLNSKKGTLPMGYSDRPAWCFGLTQHGRILKKLSAITGVKSFLPVRKHKNGHLVTITELLSRLRSVAKELPSVLQRGLESNETAQHFLNIFLRLPKGNEVGRELIHPCCFVSPLPPPPGQQPFSQVL